MWRQKSCDKNFLIKRALCERALIFLDICHVDDNVKKIMSKLPMRFAGMKRSRFGAILKIFKEDSYPPKM